ncbi:MAG: N-acetylmuramoyl-L-alanine amidase [Nitrospirae bacterium]|nr:N-acetylmuramoyl-L-alanine amidase [Candidatus Manganitrophaceae bacterium]
MAKAKRAPRRLGSLIHFTPFFNPLILLMTILAILAAPPAIFPASDGDDLKEAESCRQSLKASPEKKKIRTHWERCIQKYKSSRPFMENDGRTMMQVARLYQELYLYSNRPQDLKEARDYYAAVAERSAHAPLGKEAQRQVTRIEKLLGSALAADSPQEKSPEKGPADSGETAVVSNIRHWAYPDYTRVVIDLNRAVSVDVEKTSSVLIVRLPKASLGELFRKSHIIPVRDGTLKQIEAKQKEPDAIELLLTFKQLGSYKVVPLSDPDRLVIDLFTKKQETNRATAEKETQDGRASAPSLLPSPPPFNVQMIVIDPGHGGKDPGAIGTSGLEEKEVVLDVSLRLRDLIQKRLKKKVVMTRDQDVFIPLDERTLLANSKKADLFVSVHANSSPKRNTQGIEVYFLGRASDDRAIDVAARENATSRKATLNLQEVILNDLERDFNLNESLEFAHFTEGAFVEHLIAKYPTSFLGVKRAPFYVLANTHMPAILAEISFLTNPTEEKRLRSNSYRQKIAESLFKGIERYLDSVKTSS